MAVLLDDDIIWLNKEEEVDDDDIVAIVSFKAEMMALLEALSSAEDMVRTFNDERTLEDPAIDMTTTTEEEDDVTVTVT